MASSPVPVMPAQVSAASYGRLQLAVTGRNDYTPIENAIIQITDTGIIPGSGVGNHRNGLTKETLGVKVIGIGVPTVVDAATIVQDSMEKLLQTLEEKEKKEFLEEMIPPALYSMFVTPKDVDETMKRLSYTISEGLNRVFC